MPSLIDIKSLKRWIVASFVKELRPLVEEGYELFVEGQDRLTSRVAGHIELRIDGPYIWPIGSFGEYKTYIEVNLLGNSTRSDGIYDRHNLQGLMAFMLARNVCIYRIGNQGDNPADDGSAVEVMRWLPSDQLKVSDFGQIDPNTEVFQAVAEAHYEMYHTLG